MAIRNKHFRGRGRIVICPKASRVNHPCLPNVYHCWNKSIGGQTVHAVKDIATGEEILTTYAKICIDHSEREKQLERYGFTYDYPGINPSPQFLVRTENIAIASNAVNR